LVRDVIRPAVAGMLADSGFHDIISRMTDANVKQVHTLTVGTPTIAVQQISFLTITTAADADVFTIQINGVVVATGTSSGTDKTVQRDAIEVLLLASDYFTDNFTVADESTDALAITAIRAGEAFGVEVVVDSTSVYTWTEDTANVVGTQFKFTIDGHELLYPAESTTITTERDALLALLQVDTFFADLVVFASVSTNQISVTAITAGVPVTVVFANENGVGVAGAGTMTLAATTANVTGNPIDFGLGVAKGSGDRNTQLPSTTGFLFIGIAAKDQKEQDLTTGLNRYEEGEAVGVLRRGRIWAVAEEAVTPTSDVYLRHTANGALLPGGWRTDADTARADNVSTWAKYMTTADAGALVQIDVNLP
ncbi:MAG: hypothetical protein KAT00_07545, partial [Planctomycetes bacterium]|nr:hypothetical protein [Planctomycetota bacterium]